MRIVFVISSLSVGGAERVVVRLSNYWVEQGHQVSIVLLGNLSNLFYEVDKRVHLVPLDTLAPSPSLFSALMSNMRRLLILRKTLKELSPDIIYSFIFATNVLALLATVFLRLKLVVSERNDPRKYSEGGRIWFYLRRLVYPWAHALVVQNQSIKDWFIKYNKKILIIPNPIELSCEEKDKVEISSPCAIAVGSLTYQKGYDLLIPLFAKIVRQEKFKDWKLFILGEGTLRFELEQLISKEGMIGKIILLGAVKNVFSFLKQAQIYVMTSRFEGFPNALLEAMAVGLPVISFDCKSGPSDLIQHEENGLLVPVGDIGDLEQKLLRLMTNKNERDYLARNAQIVNSKYSMQKIAKQWEQIIEEKK